MLDLGPQHTDLSCLFALFCLAWVASLLACVSTPDFEAAWAPAELSLQTWGGEGGGLADLDFPAVALLTPAPLPCKLGPPCCVCYRN
jgi:hypothetical protein